MFTVRALVLVGILTIFAIAFAVMVVSNKKTDIDKLSEGSDDGVLDETIHADENISDLVGIDSIDLLKNSSKQRSESFYVFKRQKTVNTKPNIRQSDSEIHKL